VIFKVASEPNPLSTTVLLESLRCFTSCRLYNVTLSTENDFFRSVSVTPSSVGKALPSQRTIAIYPNPSSTTIAIESSVDLEEATLEIFDELGKRIMVTSQDLRSGDPHYIDIRSLSNGQYFLRIVSGNYDASISFTVRR